MSFPIKNGGSFHSYVSLPEGKGKNGKSVPNIHSSQETFFIPFSVFWMVCSPANPSKSREQAWLPLGNLKRTQRPSPAVVVGEWLHAQIHIVLCPIHGLCTMSVFRREIVNDGCCTHSYAGQHPVKSRGNRVHTLFHTDYTQYLRAQA